MRIGLDVDDVLFPFSRIAHALCVQAGVANGREVDRWEMHESYGCTRAEVWDDVLYPAYAEGMLLNAPYAGTRAILTALRDDHGHSVHLVTARGYEPRYGGMVREHTSRWLETYELPFDSLTFTKDKTDVRTDIFLDDSVKNVKRLVEHGTNAYLADQPHNRSDTYLHRVADLAEFCDIVKNNYTPAYLRTA